MNKHLGQEIADDSQHLSIRAPRHHVVGFRKRYVYLTLSLLVVVVAIALIVGLGIDFRSRVHYAQNERDVTPRETQPAELSKLPNSYTDLPKRETIKTNPTPTDHEPQLQFDAMREKNEELRRNLASMASAIEQIDGQNKQLLEQLARYEDKAAADQIKTWESALFIKLDDPQRTRETIDNATSIVGDEQAVSQSSVMVPPIDDDHHPSTDQQRKLAFLHEAPSPGVYLDEPYLHPRTNYELQAGTVIPAALLTGINTDLPGDVLAAVTQPVYDSRTGKHLLIPQGAKLYGSYDSKIANGQNRALLVWHRLLMPNGRSIQLDRMAGTDAAGYAGVADRVDYHVKELALGAVLSSAIAYAGNLARGDLHRGENNSGVDVIGDTVAQEAGRVGSKIIDRQLDVQPTITIRPGWPLRVLVNKDIALAPYEDR